MISDKDRAPKDRTEQDSGKENQEETQQKSQQEEKQRKQEEDTKDPHRGITDTPSKAEEMMPDGTDPEDYFDDDGAMDEELEDLDDLEEEE